MSTSGEDCRHCDGPQQENIFYHGPPPTPSPSQETIEIPEVVPCEADENGNYGAFNTTSDNILNYRSIQVGYVYQVDTFLTEELVQQEVLPSVELAIANLLIQRMFDREDCEDVAVARSAFKQLEEEQLVGLSSRPVDEVNSALPCESMDTDCHVVDGELTLIATEVPDAEVLRTQAVDFIREAMDAQVLDDVHQDVVRIRYWRDPTEGGQGTGRGVDGDDSTTEVRVWPWVTIAVGMVFLLAAVYVVYRRRTKQYTDDQQYNRSARSEASMEEGDPDILGMPPRMPNHSPWEENVTRSARMAVPA